jgi:hypothetical protein
MFGDPVTNPKGWPIVHLTGLGGVTTGNTPPRANPALYGDAIEWIKSDNINTPSHFLTHATEGLSLLGKQAGRVVTPSRTPGWRTRGLHGAVAEQRNCGGVENLRVKPLDFPLLADENIHPGVVRALAARGKDVRSVSMDGVTSKPDAEVQRCGPGGACPGRSRHH